MSSQLVPQPADEDLVLSDVDLIGADFSRRRIRDFTAVSSRFVECDFTGIRITQGGCFGAGRDYSQYVNCVFDGARWRNVFPGLSRFVRCSFRDVRIEDFLSNDAEFVECVFTGVIRRAFFSGRPLADDIAPHPKDRLEFRGNDFSGADLEDVTFRKGIDLRQQLLPEGPDYILLQDAEPVLRRAWEIVEGWPSEHPQRVSVRAFLRGALQDVEAGQTDIFCRLVTRKRPERAAALTALISRARADVAGR